MSGQFWNVHYNEIERLNDAQLTELLKRLLNLEAAQFFISPSAVSVSLNIHVSDGGQDGRIKWDDGPTRTDFVPNRFTVFQVKATKMDPSDCKKELFEGKRKGKGTPKKKQLKSKVKEVLECNGCYIIFCGREYVDDNVTKKISVMRQGLKEAGIEYWDTANFEFYGAQRIADWTNRFLSAIIFVKTLSNDMPMDGLMTWKVWSEYPSNSVYEYVENPTLSSHLTQLKSYFSEQFHEKNKCARIIGLSGLGKTRLALEVFRPPRDVNENFIQQYLSDSVIYIDGSTVDRGRLINTVRNWRIERLHGILIVDDCDFELHNKLAEEILHPDSGFSLLTLDFNPEEIREHQDPDRPCILLKPLSDDTIKTMLKQKYDGLPKNEIDIIVKFTMGFPKMAALLAKNRINGRADIYNLADKSLIEKMLWGRNAQDKEAYDIISACSIFKLFGFDGRLSEQRRFIASKICHVDDSKLYSTLVKFKEREILIQRGDLAAIVPSPLTIRLGADWWTRCSPDEVEKIIDEMPQPLIDQLCAQMPALRGHPKIIDITRRLCGEQGPFGRAEVLMSERGSRIFRDLAEVDPEITLDVLERALDNKSRDELLKFTSGRRNTIWTLEKLCFKKETFLRATRLLANLAEAENETWSNNATGLLLQLYHIRLSGTEAHPDIRLMLIDELLDSDQIEKNKLAIRALGSALESNGFSRMGGSERQGYESPLKDWEPRIYGEIYDYSRKAISRLQKVSCNEFEPELASIAQQEIVKHIRTFVRYGLMDELESCLTSIQKSMGSYWNDALIGIQEAIRFDGHRIPPEGLERLSKIEAQLKPKGLSDILFSVVSQPNFQFETNSEGSHMDVAQERAQQLALDLSKDTSWLEHSPKLFNGEQRQGFIFGLVLGKNIKNPKYFIEIARKGLSQGNVASGNPVVLGGFLKGLREVDNSLAEQALCDFSQDERMMPYFPSILSFAEASNINLRQLLDLIDEEKITANMLRQFEYGRGLQKISNEDLSDFCLVLQSHGKSYSWIGMSIFYTSINHESVWTKKQTATMKKLLKSCKVSSSPDDFRDWDIYNFCEAVNRIDPDGKDQPLLNHSIKLIIKLTEAEKLGYNEQAEIKGLLSLYFKGSPEQAWEIVGARLIEGSITGWKLEHLVWDRISNEGGQVICDLPNNTLLKWCIDNPKKAPLIISRNHPPIEAKDGSIVFSSLFQQLFAAIGYEETIIENILTNLDNGAWSGPFSGFYKKRLSIIDGLMDSYGSSSATLAKILEKYRKHYLSRLSKEIKTEEEESLRGVFE